MQDRDLDFRSIARDWYIVLSPIAFTPTSYKEAIDKLASLVQEATRLRFGESYQTADAENIGVALADLQYIQGDALGLSFKVLAGAWLNHLPAVTKSVDQERLSTLFADIANGYYKAAVKKILQQQEMMREAQLSAVRILHANLQGQKDHLSLTAERLLTLHEIESGILSAQSAEAIADIAIRHIMRIIPCLAAGILTINLQLDSFIVLASINTPQTPGDLLPLSLTTEERLKIIKNNKYIIINNLGSVENPPPGMDKLYLRNINSTMVVPLLASDNLVGILSLSSREINFFNDTHGENARQIADSVAVALHNRQLLETEQKARRESETLREVAASLRSSLDQEELLDNILLQVEKLLPYDGAIIILQDENKLQVVAQRGIQQKFIDMLNEMGELPPNMQKIMNTKEPMYIPDTRLNPEWIKIDEAIKVSSWLGAPLVFQGEIIGLLALDKNEPHFYQPSALELVLTFANHAAVAIKNAQLFKKVQQNTVLLRERIAARTRDLESLYEIAALSSQPLELPSILDTGLRRILEDLDGRSGAIHVRDRESGDFNLLVFVNLNPSNLNGYRSINRQNSFVIKLLEDQTPIVVKNAASDLRLQNWLLPNDQTSFIAAPMRARGDVQGIISLYCEPGHELTPDNIKLAVSIADQLGVTIDNARLQAQSEQAAVIEERERLARDLHDSATQSLFSLTLFAGAAREKVRSGQLDVALKHLDDIGYTANQTHRDMRLLLFELGSTQYPKEGLVEALQHRLQAVEERSGINVIFRPRQTSKLDVELEEALHQIANEALNNTLKHADCTSVSVDLFEEGANIILSVKDNGRGFDLLAAQNGAGMGLKNMHFRANQTGGKLSILSSIGEGTEVIARIPRNDSDQQGFNYEDPS